MIEVGRRSAGNMAALACPALSSYGTCTHNLTVCSEEDMASMFGGGPLLNLLDCLQ